MIQVSIDVKRARYSQAEVLRPPDVQAPSVVVIGPSRLKGTDSAHLPVS